MHEAVIRLEKKTDDFQFEDFTMNTMSIADIKKMLVLYEKNAAALTAEVARRKALLLHGVPYKIERKVPELQSYKPAAVSARHQYIVDLDLQHGYPF